MRTLNDLKRLQEHFTLLQEQHKATVKARNQTINTLSQDLGAGFLMRPVSCEEVVDLATNRMVVKRLDTGEQIEERAMTLDEIKHFKQRK